MIKLSIAILAFNIARGLAEGMDMHKTETPIYIEGVRHHRWFRVYHRIEVLVCILAGLIGYEFAILSQPIGFKESFLICSVFIFSWQGFESAYNYSRHKILYQGLNENILGMRQYLASILMAGVRIILGTVFFLLYLFS